MVNRVIRFIHDRSQKETESFQKFYTDYSIFLKEGILTEPEQVIKVHWKMKLLIQMLLLLISLFVVPTVLLLI